MFERTLFEIKYVMAICLNCIGTVILNSKLSNSSLEGATKTHIHTEGEACLKFLESALAIFEDLELREESITVHTATVLSNIGRVYSIFGDLEKALYYDQGCLGRRLFCLTSNHLDVAMSSFNAAQTMRSLGETLKR